MKHEDPKFQNIKRYLQEAMFQIDPKEFSPLKKLKLLFRGHMLSVILKVKKCLEHSTKNNCAKEIKKSL